jgi:hypothetical protein
MASFHSNKLQDKTAILRMPWKDRVGTEKCENGYPDDFLELSDYVRSNPGVEAHIAIPNRRVEQLLHEPPVSRDAVPTSAFLHVWLARQAHIPTHARHSAYEDDPIPSGLITQPEIVTADFRRVVEMATKMLPAENVRSPYVGHSALELACFKIVCASSPDGHKLCGVGELVRPAHNKVEKNVLGIAWYKLPDQTVRNLAAFLAPWMVVLKKAEDEDEMKAKKGKKSKGKSKKE